jgi:hypothetical protein
VQGLATRSTAKGLTFDGRPAASTSRCLSIFADAAPLLPFTFKRSPNMILLDDCEAVASCRRRAALLREAALLVRGRKRRKALEEAVHCEWRASAIEAALGGQHFALSGLTSLVQN